MHPLLALPIAMVTATLILGAFVCVRSLWNAPEAYEDENGFWVLEDEAVRPVRARVVTNDRVREQPADLDA